MPSVPCSALLLLTLLALPAAAQEPPLARVLHQRTLFWAPASAPLELHVAPGSATLLRLEGFPLPHPLELAEGPPTVRLLPAEEDGFLVTVSRDFAPGERARVTVKLGPPPALEVPLLLVSREDRVDGEVRLVRLQAPTPDSLGVEVLARVLRAAPQGQVRLEVQGPEHQGAKVRLHVESVLRMDSRVFVTLKTWAAGRGLASWRPEKVRLQAVLEDGARVELPLLVLPGPVKGHRPHHTLVAPFPERTLRLLLAVEDEGAPKDFHSVSPDEERPSP
jgi:Protein of unknown function (DUF2381)